MDTKIKDKNIAILKLLGYVQDGSDTWVSAVIAGYIVDLPISLSTSELKFHSDANWQFEVIEFLEHDNKAAVTICQGRCKISAAKMGDRTIYSEVDFWRMSNADFGFSAKRQAIFEALYQYSQHPLIKNQKYVTQ